MSEAEVSFQTSSGKSVSFKAKPKTRAASKKKVVEIPVEEPVDDQAGSAPASPEPPEKLEPAPQKEPELTPEPELTEPPKTPEPTPPKTSEPAEAVTLKAKPKGRPKKGIDKVPVPLGVTDPGPPPPLLRQESVSPAMSEVEFHGLFDSYLSSRRMKSRDSKLAMYRSWLST